MFSVYRSKVTVWPYSPVSILLFRRHCILWLAPVPTEVSQLPKYMILLKNTNSPYSFYFIFVCEICEFIWGVCKSLQWRPVEAVLRQAQNTLLVGSYTSTYWSAITFSLWKKFMFFSFHSLRFLLWVCMYICVYLMNGDSEEEKKEKSY